MFVVRAWVTAIQGPHKTNQETHFKSGHVLSIHDRYFTTWFHATNPATRSGGTSIAIHRSLPLTIQDSLVDPGGRCLSMNNLNNPPQWNIHPNEAGGDGSKWNYALLVPMLGLAAFRWIWSKESEKEIRRAELKYQQKITNIQKDLESKYRDIIGESRRTVAHLEIELEKEHTRVQSYRKALISQSQKLVEERKLLEHEREQLKQEIKAAQKSEVVGTLYAAYIKKEEKWQTQARGLLKEFEEALKERQNIFCSLVEPRKKRFEIEKNLLVKAATNTIAVELEMTDGLLEIFKYDTHCAVFLNSNKNKNGKLMWLYLKYWKLLVDVKKFDKIEGVMMGK